MSKKVYQKLDEFVERQQIVSAEFCKLIDRVQEMEEALEFYANKDNWSYYDIHSWSSSDSSIRGDCEMLEGTSGQKGTKYYGGKLARKVLNK